MSEETGPGSKITTPRSEKPIPGSKKNAPRRKKKSPRSKKTSPRSEEIRLKDEEATSQSEEETSESGAETPESGAITPENGVETPESGVITPRRRRRRRRRKKQHQKAVFFLVLFFLVGGIGSLIWWNWATNPYAASPNSHGLDSSGHYSAGGAGEKIMITPETTAKTLAKELEQRKLIRSALGFRLLARDKGKGFKLFVGEYTLTPAMSPGEILANLSKAAKGDVFRVTIPEGYTTEQIINLFVQKGIGSKEEFARVVTEDQFAYPFLEGAPAGIHRLEGFLFPNTYEVEKTASPRTVIEMLLRQFAKELTPEVVSRLERQKMTVAEWVILGSIIEKEAGKDTDRPLIASVFLNRLAIQQPLQSCATVQFLLDEPKKVLLNKDLEIPSPYNTYLHVGLPPGPISNPGHASLEAVLNPAETDYYYFVAKPDGYHAFARTFNEHLQNIQKYQ